MMKTIRNFGATTAVALAASLTLAPAFAAQHAPADPHAGHGAMAVMPARAAPAPTQAQAPAQAKTPAMDPGEMQMQGGKAPADARDPHAYSGGYTLDSEPYALGPGLRLRLGDEKVFASVLFDSLEAVRSKGSNSGAYDVIARIGRDYNKLVIKAEGEAAGGKLTEARTEALWSHAFATFWDAQLGLRHDSGTGPGRTWLAVGVPGLAPYWFEIDATAYLGQGGRTALRLGAEYELLVTQKLIIQPRIEANLYGKSDPARDIGKGLSDLTAGVRVRYESASSRPMSVWSGRIASVPPPTSPAPPASRYARPGLSPECVSGSDVHPPVAQSALPHRRRLSSVL